MRIFLDFRGETDMEKYDLGTSGQTPSSLFQTKNQECGTFIFSSKFGNTQNYGCFTNLPIFGLLGPLAH